MAEPKGLKKIIWAVDAFEDGETKNAVIESLRLLGAIKPPRIEPVFVLNPDQLALPLEFTATWTERYRPAAEKSIAQSIAGVDLPGLAPPHVLIQKRPSLTNSVKTLATYAKAEKADLVVLGTHGRQGLPRLFLGSFAESLLLHSKVPVMIVGPFTHPKGFQNILFATDFSPDSARAYVRVLGLAKSLGSTVTLLHAIPSPVDAVLQSGVYLIGGGWVPAPVYIQKEQEERRKTGAGWIQKAEKSGVSAKFVLQTDSPGVVPTILRYARDHAIGLIALAAESGPVTAALIGSITRQVVRSAECPVWVVHS